MKNLPDKIYLSFGEMSEDRFEKSDYKELCEDSELVTFREFKFWNADVEYTRTDAFIEKAAAYLNEKFYFNNLHYAVENNTFNCMEEMFEDFKNYMKGL